MATISSRLASLSWIAFAVMWPLWAHAAVRNVPATYRTIQAAIDAANSGDQIRVAPGTYVEQLSIGKSLSIIGAGLERSTVRAPRELRTGVVEEASIVEIHGGVNVSISNLTVRGPGAGTCEAGALGAGIRVVDGARLNLARTWVADIHDTPIAGCEHSGVGIMVGDPPSGSIASAYISDSFVSNYQAGGIIVANEGSYAEITRNIVTGPVRSAMVATDGVEFVLGAVGTASHNTVSGNRCPSPDFGCGNDFFHDFQLSGIGGGGVGTKIFGNVVFDNQVGIYVSDAADVSANLALSNDFFGIAVQDGSFTLDRNFVWGGGVAVIASATDTTAVLDRLIVVGTRQPVRKFECCGFHAVVIRHSP